MAQTVDELITDAEPPKPSQERGGEEQDQDPLQAISTYKQVIQSPATSPHDQETALVKLGELYRDQKNADGVAEVITLSLTFVSSTAKAKTAKLSVFFFLALC